MIDIFATRHAIGAALALAALLAAPAARAQVQVVEEGPATESQVVERGYLRGQGRGVQYGAQLTSPIYVSPVTPGGAGAQPVGVGAGAGVLGRVGWEFPSGFTVDLLGGIAANGVNTQGHMMMSNVLTRVDVGLAGRYMFFNETAFVPFLQLGATIRWHFFDYIDSANTVQHGTSQLTLALQGGVGFQIELSPFFGIEAGCLVEWAAPGRTFQGPGYFSVLPFAGVTLYVYDETGH